MKIHKINEFTRGWFVGNFEPSLIKTNDVEVALQNIKKGTIEKKHFHKIAKELTLIISGKAIVFDNIVVSSGDIVEIEPGEATAFEAIEDCTNLVVKYPGATNDKYIMEN